MRIRKPVYELTRLDLQQSPLWEFCSDEEGVSGQDEATVKPSQDSEVPAYSPGAYIIAADFVLADGSPAEGYIYSGEPHDLGCTQPNVVFPDGQINFWLGIIPATNERLSALYQRLGKKAESVFPIHYKTRVPINGKPMKGVVEGFGTRSLGSPTPNIIR
ncbi:MAG: hypothetical protein WB523_15640 [Candidatus Sulfotelmatobacter sp.]